MLIRCSSCRTWIAGSRSWTWAAPRPWSGPSPRRGPPGCGSATAVSSRSSPPRSRSAPRAFGPSTCASAGTAAAAAQLAPQGVLFVPFCCDWDGLNDQLAVGTPAAIRAYASRYSLYKTKGSCSFPAPEIQTLKSVRPPQGEPPIAIHRFWFEYTLLRGDLIETLKSLNKHQGYQDSKHIVSGRHQFNGIIDVGTFCSRNPVNVPKAHQERQAKVSGKKRWVADDLKCTLLPPLPLASSLAAVEAAALDAAAAAGFAPSSSMNRTRAANQTAFPGDSRSNPGGFLGNASAGGSGR
mmetsp:Transcript_4825/g.11345  ORF Transcript_4825/g.11345 Transcript_4825/m.11345 type:complete len:295 (-) Transcript_4825:280-1164(-)